MRRHLIVCLCAAALTGLAFRPVTPAPAQAQPADRPVEAKKARLAASKQAYELLMKRQEQGLGPAGPEERVTWSRRWMDAERALAADGAARRAAAEAHVERVKPLLQAAEQLFQSGQVPLTDVLAMRYHVADAEVAAAEGQ